MFLWTTHNCCCQLCQAWHAYLEGRSLSWHLSVFFQIVYIIDTLLALFPRCAPGCGVACTAAACSTAIRNVNFMHLALRAEHQLCNMAWQLEPALPTLTCCLPYISGSLAYTRVSMSDPDVFFGNMWALVLEHLEKLGWRTPPRGSRKRCLHCYLTWLTFMATSIPIHSVNDWMASTFMIVCVLASSGN